MTAPLVARPRRSGSGPGVLNVLLLHGMGGGVGSWDPLDELLAPNLRLWDVTFPWSTSGEAGWNHDSDVARWAAEGIRAAERAAGAPVDLVVAHSFAANVMLELADRDEYARRLPMVLICPFYRADTADFDWSVMGRYVEGFRRMLDEGIRLRAGHRIDQVTRLDMVGRLCDLMGPYTWLRFFDTFLRTPFLRLPRLDGPILVVGGELDEGATADDARRLAVLLPRAAAAILDGCGHFPMAERPEALATLVNDFASTLRPDRDQGNHHGHLLERRP
jgi:pimeloyl-ACP methyl ester carboxylesterase